MSEIPSSVEQMVRDLLELAIKEHLVDPSYREWDDPDPQCRSSGELVGVANLLHKYLADQNDRWQRAVGHDLETAESLAASLME